MSEPEHTSPDNTYRAIGRFMFEFSQVEYAIRDYLAEEIGLDDQHFAAVVGSYDVTQKHAPSKTRPASRI